MSRAWYGNINNRIAENRQFVDEIKVGTGVTEYMWSDRCAYEVTKVIDQKHIKIRKYDVNAIGESMSNTWQLISNPENHEFLIVKRGNYWYTVSEATIEDLERYEKAYANHNDPDIQLWWCHNGFDTEKIRKSGSQRKYHKINISIGIADYYYDYEF